MELDAQLFLALNGFRIVLKGHLQPAVCTAVVHLTEIICCNAETTNVLIVFENRIVSSQPKEIAGCDTLLKRNIDTILLSNTEIKFMISVVSVSARPQCTLFEGAPLRHAVSFLF